MSPPSDLDDRPIASGPSALEVVGVRYTVATRTLLAGVELTVGRGSSVAVMGPSGSGKSTLLACVLGLIAPDSGTIRVAGTAVDVRDKRGLVELRRRKVGVVFQFGELLPELSPLENVALAALLAGRDRDDAFDSAVALMERLGVATTAPNTTQLSGGERQRIALARALVNRPALILADEPTGSLDTLSKNVVATMLLGLPHEYDCALLVVTHDRSVAERADRTLELVDGVLVEPSVLSSP